ncbi:hypothetical protein GCM10010104_23880 [Streptomyces indiaensis]|uniref:Uncharacterized protein n=1 Tax=Streptomyces indiaensis TaxID=284033 RepID=A0ABP5QA49_9ACTN
MAGTIGKLATFAAAATAVVTFAESPAIAADTAYNARTVWLDGTPKATDADASSASWRTWSQALCGPSPGRATVPIVDTGSRSREVNATCIATPHGVF